MGDREYCPKCDGAWANPLGGCVDRFHETRLENLEAMAAQVDGLDERETVQVLSAKVMTDKSQMKTVRSMGDGMYEAVDSQGKLLSGLTPEAQAKAEELGREIGSQLTDLLVNGDPNADPDQFKGLDDLVPSNHPELDPVHGLGDIVQEQTPHGDLVLDNQVGGLEPVLVAGGPVKAGDLLVEACPWCGLRWLHPGVECDNKGHAAAERAASGALAAWRKTNPMDAKVEARVVTKEAQDAIRAQVQEHLKFTKPLEAGGAHDLYEDVEEPVVLEAIRDQARARFGLLPTIVTHDTVVRELYHKCYEIEVDGEMVQIQAAEDLPPVALQGIREMARLTKAKLEEEAPTPQAKALTMAKLVLQAQSSILEGLAYEVERVWDATAEFEGCVEFVDKEMSSQPNQLNAQIVDAVSSLQAVELDIKRVLVTLLKAAKVVEQVLELPPEPPVVT